MQGESSDMRAEETVSCNARDLACARLLAMQGEACALTTNDARLPPQTRGRRLRCALADARNLPRLMPADATKEDQERAALAVFDAWRSARDGKNPEATPAALGAAVNSIQDMPGGGPYANALAADTMVYDVLTEMTSNETDCSKLRQAQQLLPASDTRSQLADRVDSLRLVIQSASAKRSCAA
ncbi:MAG: hypothetical protein JOY71_03945 [Acetobacteraceae bacterium]|nr:hypothetical protein [Acetobacteraceae bacterium]